MPERWEYRWLKDGWGQQETWNHLGAKGWELVGVSGRDFIFKRRVVEGAPQPDDGGAH